MRILYLDCSLGADALRIASALMGLTKNRESVIGKLNNMGLRGIRFSYEEKESAGLMLSVDPEDTGEERREADLSEILDPLLLSETVKEDLQHIMRTLSEASENKAIDREILSILACTCVLMDELKPDKIYSSPICLGKGPLVREDRTIMVPSPATATLLRGVPVFAGSRSGELCTTEAAVILKYYVDQFEAMPLMTVTDISCGKDRRGHQPDYPAAYLGYSQEGEEDTVFLIHANLDDMTGEAIGFAQEMIWECGALDVYVTPIQMKKNRPGVQLSCICREDDKENCIDAFLRYTTTLGVRYEKMERRVLSRSFSSRQTEAGEIRIKKSFSKDIVKEKAEYEDLCSIARKKKLSLKEAEKYLL